MGLYTSHKIHSSTQQICSKLTWICQLRKWNLGSSVLNIRLYNRKYKGYSVQQVHDLSYLGFNLPEKYDKPDKQNTFICVYMWMYRQNFEEYW
jgi:hypothetical protein